LCALGGAAPHAPCGSETHALIDFIDKKFTDLLLEKGLITAEQLTQAIERAEQNREPLDKVLVDLRAAPT